MHKMSCDTVLSELRLLTGIHLACPSTLEESKCLSAAHMGDVEILSVVPSGLPITAIAGIHSTVVQSLTVVSEMSLDVVLKPFELLFKNVQGFVKLAKLEAEVTVLASADFGQPVPGNIARRLVRRDGHSTGVC
jgi:hypothetical protein